MYNRFVYVPDPQWLGWRDPWRMAACAYELVDCELAKLDRFERRPSRNKRWRAPRPFLTKAVRRVMPKLKACLKHRQAIPYRSACDAWRRSHRFPKPYHDQLDAVDHLMDGFGVIVNGESSPAGHFRDLTNCLSLSKAQVEAIMICYRLDDFTNGQGHRIEDEDVGLACLAACEVGKHQIAHEIVLRALGEAKSCTL
jgi:hypothetical protein